MRLRPVIGALAVATLGLGLAGCGSTHRSLTGVADVPDPTTTTSTTLPDLPVTTVSIPAALTTTTLAGATTTAAASATTAAAVPSTAATTTTVAKTTTTTVPPIKPCASTALAVAVAGGPSGAGHVSVIFLLRNSGTTTCKLRGYPTVVGLGAGAPVTATPTPDGYLGGVIGVPITEVDLSPGAAASSMLEGTDIPQAPATDCTTFTSFQVTPPGTTTVHPIGADLANCSGIDIHPVVPGTTGVQR